MQRASCRRWRPGASVATCTCCSGECTKRLFFHPFFPPQTFLNNHFTSICMFDLLIFQSDYCKVACHKIILQGPRIIRGLLPGYFVLSVSEAVLGNACEATSTYCPECMNKHSCCGWTKMWCKQLPMSVGLAVRMEVACQLL